MKNIILVGFMGTGKTVTAKLLAKQLKMRYVSIDGIIEEKEKRKIADIFVKDGEEFFRNIESRIIKDISQESGVVIDAGGGAVVREENIKNFKANGVVICLSASVNAVLSRTENQAHRPLLNVDNPKKRIEELLARRAKYYAKADHTIDTTGLTIAEVVEKIKNTVL